MVRRDDAQVLRLRLDLAPEEFWRLVRHGDRLGPDAIHTFLDRLEEKTRGYRLPFPTPEEDRVPKPHDLGHLVTPGEDAKVAGIGDTKSS